MRDYVRKKRDKKELKIYRENPHTKILKTGSFLKKK